MGLGRNQLSLTTDGLTERTVLSALPVVLSDVVARNKRTTVFADEIVINTEVLIDGHDLNLICRTLRFEAGGVIRTNGLPGLPSFQPNQRLEAAYNPGQGGLDGEDGGNGAPAGSLTIRAHEILGPIQASAVGGAGGRPRDGGHGQKGSPGPAGKDARARKSDEYPSGTAGGNGGPGGRAGLPGKRGRGGAGGSVLISTSAPHYVLPNGAIDVSHGRHGDPGQAGNPGEGGDEGPGGRISIPVNCEILDLPKGPFDFISEVNLGEAVAMPSQPNLSRLQMAALALEDAKVFRSWCQYEYSHSGYPGQRGSAGDSKAAEVAVRQTAPVGEDGELRVETHSTADFSDLFDGEFLELLVLYTEDQYRSTGLRIDSDLKDRIRFLLTVCVADESPSLIKKEVMARVYSMARKINLGLDFFGYSRERAPLLAFETYSQHVNTSVLSQAKSIEDAFNGYWDANDNTEKQRTQIRAAVAAANGRKVDLEIEFERAEKEARALLEQIPVLDNKIEAAKEILMQREVELTEVINAKSNGCNLVSTLTSVATIVVGVSTGGAGFITAAQAGTKLYGDFTANNDSLQTLWDNSKLLSDDLEELGKGAKSVAESVEAIRKGMDGLTAAQKQAEVPQFTMERESFDKVARDFADLPEAEEYREAGYEYLKCVESRNSALLAYNGLLAHLTEMQAQIAAGSRAVAALESELSGTADPSEVHIKVLMSRIYLDSLALAASMVHAETKALAYHFGRPTDAPLSALNVSTITYAHQKLLIRDWVAAKERYEARRELESGEVELDLKELVSAAQWDLFLEQLVLSFTIRWNHPTYWAIWENLPGIRITGMELVLQGAKVADGQKQIPWRMAQGGHETIYLGTGRPVVFTHRSVMFRGFTSLTGSKPIIRMDFSEKDLYAGLSPFATWLLSLSSNPSLKLDLSELESAKLKLSGYTIEG